MIKSLKKHEGLQNELVKWRQLFLYEIKCFCRNLFLKFGQNVQKINGLCKSLKFIPTNSHILVVF